MGANNLIDKMQNLGAINRFTIEPVKPSILDDIKSEKFKTMMFENLEKKKSLEIIKGGKPLSEALKDRTYMLPLVPQMSSIGEQSGKIDEMLGKAAQVYENELDEQINSISTMIEPILMVIMAGLIGVVVGGTLLPIYSLVNSVST